MSQQQRNEKKSAIENCVRSFIIKSIHAIVQARNGIVYNTNCISAVGARNNLMVNVEEDPEIGATIKHTLDSGFPVHIQDVISLEILTAWPNGERMVVEVWQFRLDTADRLDRLQLASEHSSSVTDNPAVPSSDGIAAQPEVIAIEDFRQSRLFEKLGTLLKAVIITTRLLPAYRLSRNQDPSRYQMCYTLRRGSTNVARLGQDIKYQQVGRLFSGLATKPLTANQAESHKPSDSPDSLDHVYLNCTVHFRPKPPTCAALQSRIPAPSWVKAGTLGDTATSTSKRGRSFDPRNPEVECIDERKPFSRVRPAFAENHFDDPRDDQENSHPMLMNAGHSGSNRPGIFQNAWSGEGSDGDDVENDPGALYDSDPDERDDMLLTETLHSKEGHYSPLETANDNPRRDDLQPPAPLQLPFSTVGVSGDRLTHLFVELRENANLDLFQVPPNTMGSAGTAQSSLFDADALSDELERHEKILKEFDDFLAVFCPMEPFGPDVRPLGPIRPIQFPNEPL